MTFTFAKLAKLTGANVYDLRNRIIATRTGIAHKVNARSQISGVRMSFDKENETATLSRVAPPKTERKAPRSVARKGPLSRKGNVSSDAGKALVALPSKDDLAS